MAVALLYNGTAVGSLPGSPLTSDTISIDNGSQRASFTYGDHYSGGWNFDKYEYFNGAVWVVAAYVRDRIRVQYNGEATGTSGPLTLITNNATTITLRLAAGTITQNSVAITPYSEITVSTTLIPITVNHYMTTATATNGTQSLDYYGMGFLSPGKISDIQKTLVYGDSPVTNNDYTMKRVLGRNDVVPRTFSQLNNKAAINQNFNRGYSFGGGFMRTDSANSAMFTYMDPASYKNLLEVQGGYAGCQYGQGGYANYWKNIDNKWQSQHDNTINMLGMGLGILAATNTSTTYTVKYYMYATAIANPTDDQFVREWNTFALNASGKLNVSQDTTVTLPALSSAVLPTMASTYTGSSYIDSTYGWLINIGSSGDNTALGNAYTVQAALRLYRFVGTADSLATATKFANILINHYQATTGVQTGAFYHLHYGSPAAYKCQESTHAADTDQPHVALYNHGEVSMALLDYYKVTSDSATATALDAAAQWLVKTQNIQGFWPADLNNVNAVPAQHPITGGKLASSSTVYNAAFLLEWAAIRNGVNSNATTWKNTGTKGIEYWLNFEKTPHSTYEYGEQQNTLSSHAIRMLVGGFARAYLFTGNTLYQQASMYYFEMAVAQTNKVDTVYNAAGSNNKDIHTGGLLNTLDQGGVVGPEAMSILFTLATDGLRVHTDIRKHHLFALYAMLYHTLWGMKDTTYTTPSPFGYSYCSPGTSYAAAGGLDNTRMGFHPASAALMLLPHYYLVTTSNPLIYATALDAYTTSVVANARSIIVYNSQATTQTATLAVNNMSNAATLVASSTTPGVVSSSSVSGTTLNVSISLAADQIALIKVA